MARGFLLGKFLPPHQGHVLLCDFARDYVEDLTILVCSLARDSIPGTLRFAWMKELFPEARVVHLTDEVPQEPAEHPDFWPIWRGIVKRAHPEPIDFVFASEHYGHRLAAEVGGRFVPVDPPRFAVPAAGRDVLGYPFAHWERIPAPVRPYFVKRICLFGPESTGKSTLARRLAAHFDTLFVPEYGRTHTEHFGTDCKREDLVLIARGHEALTAAAARQANRILLLDTDPVLTAVWSDMLLGQRDPRLNQIAKPADLYLNCDVDVPWIDDGTRYFPDPETRARFAERCQAELTGRNLPHVPLTGDWEERFQQAVATITDRFPQLAAPAGSRVPAPSLPQG
jgi:NadR type nicotinamide-nucleotide adenylyltransferase